MTYQSEISRYGDLAMEDLQTIALSALTRESALRMGYKNVKPKHIEAVLEFCKGKDKINPFLLSLAFTVCPNSGIRFVLSGKRSCIRSKREGAPSSSAARDASVSAMSHLAISLLLSLFIAFLW